MKYKHVIRPYQGSCDGVSLPASLSGTLGTGNSSSTGSCAFGLAGLLALVTGSNGFRNGVIFSLSVFGSDAFLGLFSCTGLPGATTGFFMTKHFNDRIEAVS